MAVYTGIATICEVLTVYCFVVKGTFPACSACHS